MATIEIHAEGEAPKPRPPGGILGMLLSAPKRPASLALEAQEEGSAPTAQDGGGAQAAQEGNPQQRKKNTAQCKKKAAPKQRKKKAAPK